MILINAKIDSEFVHKLCTTLTFSLYHLFSGDRFSRAIYRSPTLGHASSTCELELYYYMKFNVLYDSNSTTEMRESTSSLSSSSSSSSTEVAPYLLGAVFVKYFDERTPEGAIIWSTIWNKGDSWNKLTVGIGHRNDR